ncbi:MAG TPA: transglycosylase family protein [Acidimicrobiales bacterium]
MSPLFRRERRARRAVELGLAATVALSALILPGQLHDGGSTTAAAAGAPTTETTSTTVSLSDGSSDGFTHFDEGAFRHRWAVSPTFRMSVAYLNGTPEERAALDHYLVPQPPAPAPVAAPVAVKVAAPAPAPSPAVANGSVWDRLAQCEASGNWATHTANGFSGGLQFVNSTWTGFGGGQFAPQAWQASREQQIVVAERVLASSGWGAWPACSRKLGLR